VCTSDMAVLGGGVEVPVPEEVHASNTEDTTASPPTVAPKRRISLRLTGGGFWG
jgi:hypothetical protein